MTKAQIITALIAIYGALLSTFNAIRDYIVNRVSVKLEVRRDQVVVGDPRYEGMNLVMIQVINLGRRPVTIIGIGAARFYPLKHFVAFDTRPPLPAELTEGKYLTCLIDEKGVDYSTIDYWHTWDSGGRTYKLREASLLRHLKSALQRRFAPKKQPQGV